MERDGHGAAGQHDDERPGGHITTFASAATLYEIGQNHFFRGRNDTDPGDVVFYQGHASPGMYARAFLEGRLTESQLDNFRLELQPRAAGSAVTRTRG